MELNEVKLSAPEAWEWVEAHGFPGLPSEGQSLCWEDLGKRYYCNLCNRGNSFFLSKNPCVSLEDGGYYKDRVGDVVRVFHAYPGSTYPFEDVDYANRYMADGRYVRRAASREDMDNDLVGPASASEIEAYEGEHADMPGRDEYAKTAELAREALMPGEHQVAIPVAVMSGLGLVPAAAICVCSILGHGVLDPVVRRCSGSLLAEFRYRD